MKSLSPKKKRLPRVPRRMISSYPGAMAELSLAMAQAHMAYVIKQVGRDEIARILDWRPSHLDNLLKGEHDLTVRELAMVMEAAGFELRFNRRLIVRSKPYPSDMMTCP